MNRLYQFPIKRELNKTHFITSDDWGLSPSINRGILTLAQKILLGEYQ